MSIIWWHLTGFDVEEDILEQLRDGEDAKGGGTGLGFRCGCWGGDCWFISVIAEDGMMSLILVMMSGTSPESPCVLGFLVDSSPKTASLQSSSVSEGGSQSLSLSLSIVEAVLYEQLKERGGQGDYVLRSGL